LTVNRILKLQINKYKLLHSRCAKLSLSALYRPLFLLLSQHIRQNNRLCWRYTLWADAKLFRRSWGIVISVCIHQGLYNIKL